MLLTSQGLKPGAEWEPNCPCGGMGLSASPVSPRTLLWKPLDCDSYFLSPADTETQATTGGRQHGLMVSGHLSLNLHSALTS